MFQGKKQTLRKEMPTKKERYSEESMLSQKGLMEKGIRKDEILKGKTKIIREEEDTQEENKDLRKGLLGEQKYQKTKEKLKTETTAKQKTIKKL